MPDPFASPKRRIARAQTHIEDFQIRSGAFFGRKPYTSTVDPHPDGFHQLHKIKFTEPLPDELTDLAAECIEALRSALDQTGYACAVAGGKANPKSAYFPIADTAAKLDTDVIGRGRCKDLPADILALFRSFKPWKAGNLAVWLLNQLVNVQKHRLLTSVAAQTDRVRIKQFYGTGPAALIPRLEWDSTENELVFAITEFGADIQYDLEFSFFVAFGEIEGIANKPTIPILRRLLREVRTIVSATEIECRRVGLIM